MCLLLLISRVWLVAGFTGRPVGVYPFRYDLVSAGPTYGHQDGSSYDSFGSSVAISGNYIQPFHTLITGTL
ncbi:hypothetical protein [Fibrella arboris]|uniref:hypothetical protein n=1 Tax=Fibrella arboris TaxID=3242486 RepID=UPI003522CD66